MSVLGVDSKQDWKLLNIGYMPYIYSHSNYCLMYDLELKKFKANNKQQSAASKFQQSIEVNDEANGYYIEYIDKLVVTSWASLSASFTIFLALQDSFPTTIRFKITLFALWAWMVVAILFWTLTKYYYAKYLSNKWQCLLFEWHKERQEWVIMLEKQIVNLNEKKCEEIKKNIDNFNEEIPKMEKIGEKVYSIFWRFYLITMGSFSFYCIVLFIILGIVAFRL